VLHAEIVNIGGVERVLVPEPSEIEMAAMLRSAAALRNAPAGMATGSSRAGLRACNPLSFCAVYPTMPRPAYVTE
jgi:hypothetical protein